MMTKLIRFLTRLRILNEIKASRYLKKRELLEDINQANNFIAETTLLDKPFFYEPLRTTRSEVFGLSGLQKIREHDNYRLDLIKSETHPVILDIGSHIGIFPRVIKERFPSSSVYSIEPDRDNFRVLRMNNEFLSDTRSFQYGIYEYAKKIRLRASDQNSWRSTLDINPSFFREELVGDDSFSFDDYHVECVSIDQFVKDEEIEKLDLIGITISGEIALPVLNGAIDTLKSLEPIFSVFLYQAERETVASFFGRCDYHLVGEPRGGMHTFVRKEN